jgi:acyl-CoA hydrolase
MQVTSAERAVEAVRSEQRIYLQGTSATPHVLLGAVTARAAELRDVRIIHLHTEGSAPHVAPQLAASFRHEALFVGANTRDAVNAGRADYIPAFLSEVPVLFSSRRIPLDVAFINVSPPDERGYCSLGTSVECTASAVAAATTVIAQINTSMPRTHGDSLIHSDQIDYAVEVNAPPYAFEPSQPNEVEARIGQFVASLIPDGATLQLGIGSIPNAVLASLTQHRDLAVHTEMFSDGVVDLVERGVITGARHPHHPGKLISAFVMGTAHLYDFVHDNAQVNLYPVDYTNDTRVIRAIKDMVAINSALEIDLTGQATASSIGDRIYSGVGGQVDFIRGAALAEGGRPILALPSTAAGGTVSRIVPHLRPGSMVTLTQAHVHYVVTEYGIADLYGQNLRKRAQALTAVAHPAYRDELRAAVRELLRA